MCHDARYTDGKWFSSWRCVFLGCQIYDESRCVWSLYTRVTSQTTACERQIQGTWGQKGWGDDSGNPFVKSLIETEGKYK